MDGAGRWGSSLAWKEGGGENAANLALIQPWAGEHVFASMERGEQRACARGGVVVLRRTWHWCANREREFEGLVNYSYFSVIVYRIIYAQVS